MSGIKILSNRISVIFIIFLICCNYNNVWANNFISRGHYVIDLSQKLEWLTCPVGMIWKNKTCVGEALKLKFDEVDQVILQANNNLKVIGGFPKDKN